MNNYGTRIDLILLADPTGETPRPGGDPACIITPSGVSGLRASEHPPDESWEAAVAAAREGSGEGSGGVGGSVQGSGGVRRGCLVGADIWPDAQVYV